MWFELKGDERITQRCATEGCGGQPTWRLEADGVGSNYCSGCKAKIGDDILDTADLFLNGDGSGIGGRNLIHKLVDEVKCLRTERDELFSTNGEIANTIGAEALRLRAALVHVRAIIKDGALTGFNCHDGDWAERLFASQGLTHAALHDSSQQDQKR